MGQRSADASWNSDVPGTAANGELVFLGTPLHAGSRTIDTEQHESRLPTFGSLGPDVCVPVLGTGDDAVGVWCPRDCSDELVVLFVSCASMSPAIYETRPWGTRQEE